MEVGSAIWKLYPANYQADRIDRLLLNKNVLNQLKAGRDPRQIAAGWQAELNGFKARRQKYLLYQQTRDRGVLS
jgi:uncharacterized protein YbbC (DUF1343 family)